MVRLALLVVLLVGCGSSTAPAVPAAAAEASPAPAPAAPRATRGDLDVAGLKAALDGGSVRLLVDVRTPGEFAEGHVPGAINIPLNELSQRIGDVGAPDDAPVHVICRSGSRSAKASELLVKSGLSAINVTGGTMAWIDAGNPTE